MIKMVPYYKEIMNFVRMDGSVLHMRYYAYILNLIVKVELEVLSDGFRRIRESIAH